MVKVIFVYASSGFFLTILCMLSIHETIDNFHPFIHGGIIVGGVSAIGGILSWITIKLKRRNMKM